MHAFAQANPPVFGKAHARETPDPALAARQAMGHDDEVERRRHLAFQDVGGQVDAEARHHDQTQDRLARRARMQRGERTVVPCVHGLQHVDRLAAAHLSHHDPVGPHTQRIDDEHADGDLACTLDGGVTGLKAGDVRLGGKLELGGVLDGHDALARVDLARQGVEQRRLARSGSPHHGDVLPGAHRRPQKACIPGGERLQAHHFVQRGDAAHKLADGEQGAVHRHRGNHSVDAIPVFETRVHDGALFVKPAAQGGDDAVDGGANLLVGVEHALRPVQGARALKVQRPRPVHDDLAHGLVAHICLKRTQADDVVAGLSRKNVALRGSQRLKAALVHNGRKRNGELGACLLDVGALRYAGKLAVAQVSDKALFELGAKSAHVLRRGAGRTFVLSDAL